MFGSLKCQNDSLFKNRNDVDVSRPLKRHNGDRLIVRSGIKTELHVDERRLSKGEKSKVVYGEVNDCILQINHYY